MTVNEALYHQEVLILAYMFIHPDELDKLDNSDFSNVSTAQMHALMRANYSYNNNQCIQAHQIIDAMAKNIRFQNLLDQFDLIERVLSCKEEFIVTKAIFDGYVQGIKQKKGKNRNDR